MIKGQRKRKRANVLINLNNGEKYGLDMYKPKMIEITECDKNYIKKAASDSGLKIYEFVNRALWVYDYYSKNVK